MSIAETIFNPINDSLEARVEAYYSVCQAFSLSQSSLKQTQKAGEVDYLGDEASVQQAFDLANSSLKQANAQVSKEDLQSAQESGLLTSEQFAEILQTQRAQELSIKRQAQSSHSHQIKR